MFHLSVALLLAAGSTTSFAADDTAAPVIITATRTAQSADAALASVTVITRADLEREQALSVQDALRSVVGLSLDNNGGMGKATAVFLRGTESAHVLVLIDGVKVGSATLGTTSFQDIPVDQIERIEIVRGPRSSLYGSEAIGGVIQIFTRRGNGKLTPSFGVGVGSHDTGKLTAGISGGDADNWINVNLSALNTGGINACSGNPSGGGCNTNEPDADGYRNQSATLRAGHRFADSTEVEVTTLRTQGHNHFDSSYANEADFAQQALGGQLRFSPSDIWHATILAGQSRDNSKYFLGDADKDTYKTRRDTMSFQNDIAPTENQIATVGIDYQKDVVGGTTDYDVASRDNKGVFVQYQFRAGKHDVQLSARSDDNQQFDRHNTYGLMVGHNLAPGVRLKASYGTAFKAPTFNELYYPGYGNAALVPEKSRSGEIGVDGHPAWGHWSANVFQTKVTDLIVFRGPTYIADNIDAARIRGMEATVSATLASWLVTANTTLINPEDRSPGVNHGELLARRTRQIANIDLGRQFGSVNVATSMHAEGKRYDYFDPAFKDRLGGFATVDVHAELPIAPEWLLQARVANLFDKHYETARYFNQDGRNYFITVRYQPSAKQL
jgi:vitamin B12 transporter